LVDTGSPICVFPAGAAEALGIEVGRWDTPGTTVHILGRPWVAEFHHIVFEIPQFEGDSWETEVAFLVDEIAMPYGLLGHRGFLDRWTVTFHYYDNYFMIERPDDFERRQGIDPDQLATGSHDSEWDRPGPS